MDGANKDGTRVELIGYKEPGVEVDNANGDDAVVLRRLLANDPAISGLEVRVVSRDYRNYDGEDHALGHNDWDKKVASAISNNNQLQKLLINVDSVWTLNVSDQFLEQVAENRSMKHLCLDGFGHAKIDVFRILAPFLKHNINLRCIEIRNTELKRIPFFTSVLMQSTTIHLEQIILSGTRIEDESAGDFVNALNSMPGLCHLKTLSLSSNNIGCKGCMALGGLLKNDATRLQVLCLFGNNLDDECMKDLTNGLSKNKTIKDLDLSYLRQVTPNGWRTFSAYLLESGCSVEKLDLQWNHIGEEGVISLGNTMTRNTSLKLKHICLGLMLARVNFAGWHAFSTGLRSSAIRKLYLYDTDIDDSGAISIVSALAGVTSLKILNLSTNPYITPHGWTKCLRLLIDSDLMLEELYLGSNNIDDAGAEIVFEALVKNNASLKSLNLACCDDITSDGWIWSFRLLLDSKSSLETLNLKDSDIDDEGASILIKLLGNDFSLTSLSLGGNDSLTIDGWCAFARLLLPSSSSKLKVLKLWSYHRRSRTNDRYVIAFAQALAMNTSLEELELFNSVHDNNDEELEIELSIEGWNAFTKAMCDSSSIINVCSSNHTLHKLFHFYDGFIPPSLQSLLKLNRMKNTSEVARAKIIKHYFSIASNVESTFSDFSATMMPDAMSWIGKDCLGFSTMYRLIRCVVVCI